MLFTNPRTGKAIAEKIGSQYQPSNTRRSAASSDGQNEPIADNTYPHVCLAAVSLVITGRQMKHHFPIPKMPAETPEKGTTNRNT